MTEQEWLTCDKPKMMRRVIGKKASGRKMRLLLCAICHEIIELDSTLEDHHRQAMLREELAADDIREDRVVPVDQIFRSTHDADRTDSTPALVVHLVEAVLKYDPKNSFRAALEWGSQVVSIFAAANQQKIAISAFLHFVCDLFRELFPPHKREYRLLPAFAGGGVLLPSGHTFSIPETALAIAKGVQADQAFDRLPILADALEDANCSDRPWLDHLRHGTNHRRGCWALDLVLGKQ